jgi:hypothetical protein
MRTTLLTSVLLLAAVSPTLAQDAPRDPSKWAEAMFDHTSHDFGTVARGQKVEHHFPFKNIYLEDISIGEVRSGCRCLTPKVSKEELKTYEKGEVVVTADTRRFLGRKDTTVKVPVTASGKEGPMLAEVQLHCYLYIRSDVVIQPGEVRLDSTPHGTAVPPKKVSILYAGREDWEIVREECDNPHLDLELIERGRHAGQVSYDLLVGLKASAPVGYVRENVVLTTNDTSLSAKRLLVPVAGIVTSAVSIRPSFLMLGLLKPGQTVERTLMVRGNKPFRVVGVSGPDDRFRFQWTDATRTLHVIPFTYTAADEPGKVAGKILIETDVTGSEVVEVKFDGQVVAPSLEDTP